MWEHPLDYLGKSEKDRTFFIEFKEIDNFGVLGVEPRSQDPQPCIIAVILHPVELILNFEFQNTFKN